MKARTWSASWNGEVKLIVMTPSCVIEQNCGLTADTWKSIRRTRASAGSGSTTRPRFDTATVRPLLFARLMSRSSRSLSGRGTIRSSGLRSNRRNRRSFASSASGVVSGRNCAARSRQMPPRSSSPWPYVCATRTVAKKLRGDRDGKNWRRFTGTDAAMVWDFPSPPEDSRIASKKSAVRKSVTGTP